jgi:hypothetical protein
MTDTITSAGSWSNGEFFAFDVHDRASRRAVKNPVTGYGARCPPRRRLSELGHRRTAQREHSRRRSESLVLSTLTRASTTSPFATGDAKTRPVKEPGAFYFS